MKALLFLLTVLLFAGTSLAAKQPELPSDETIVNMVTEIFTEAASASFGYLKLAPQAQGAMQAQGQVPGQGRMQPLSQSGNVQLLLSTNACPGCDLRGANLIGANLSGANLSKADLRGADMDGIVLTGANLELADLRGADLSGADLQGADLSNADFSAADLTRATLVGAILSNTLGVIRDRYVLRGSTAGIAWDVQTDLEWMRCSIGQNWFGSGCSGESTRHSFDQLGSVANALNQGGGYQGFTDWRVPTIEELRTLVYCSNTGQIGIENSWCGASFGSYGQPTILTEAFPNTPADPFWSGSPNATHSDLAWFVGFYNGYAYDDGRGSGFRVRLVRGGQKDRKSNRLR